MKSIVFEFDSYNKGILREPMLTLSSLDIDDNRYQSLIREKEEEILRLK